uniref:Uncharacterized protein n=1 Tax=Branchiostoma floridae TaxID=7739 RepID=C3ZUN5_BRAFL|eukprot:XP_002587736.1 hypothetical protein BRAFLDRAFT_94639 [Branchiostoma floridae]
MEEVTGRPTKPLADKVHLSRKTARSATQGTWSPQMWPGRTQDENQMGQEQVPAFLSKMTEQFIQNSDGNSTKCALMKDCTCAELSDLRVEKLLRRLVGFADFLDLRVNPNPGNAQRYVYGRIKDNSLAYRLWAERELLTELQGEDREADRQMTYYFFHVWYRNFLKRNTRLDRHARAVQRCHPGWMDNFVATTTELSPVHSGILSVHVASQRGEYQPKPPEILYTKYLQQAFRDIGWTSPALRPTDVYRRRVPALKCERY